MQGNEKVRLERAHSRWLAGRREEATCCLIAIQWAGIRVQINRAPNDFSQEVLLLLQLRFVLLSTPPLPPHFNKTKLSSCNLFNLLTYCAASLQTVLEWRRKKNLCEILATLQFIMSLSLLLANENYSCGIAHRTSYKVD
jgi:hypothetical protein